jgi:hypothetical protein
VKPTSEGEGGLWYGNGGTTFSLFTTPFAGTAKNTEMEWTVDDVPEGVEELKSRGVSFDTFEMEGMEFEGERCHDGEHEAAWFEDSEGKVLAITS